MAERQSQSTQQQGRGSNLSQEEQGTKQAGSSFANEPQRASEAGREGGANR